MTLSRPLELTVRVPLDSPLPVDRMPETIEVSDLSRRLGNVAVPMLRTTVERLELADPVGIIVPYRLTSVWRLERNA